MGTPRCLVLGLGSGGGGTGGSAEVGSLVGGSLGGHVQSRWLNSSTVVWLKSVTVPCLGQGLVTSGALGTGGSAGLVMERAND